MNKTNTSIGLVLLAIFLIIFFTVKVADNRTKTLYDVLKWNIETNLVGETSSE